MDKDYNPSLALVEAETRYRLATADEPGDLEVALIEEHEKIVQLKQRIEQNIRTVNTTKRDMLSYQREAKFYRDKLFHMDQQYPEQSKLKGDHRTIQHYKGEITTKLANLLRLRKCLEDFDGMEPTNCDLRRRIDELKASRLNLEMTFVGDSP